MRLQSITTAGLCLALAGCGVGGTQYLEFPQQVYYHQSTKTIQVCYDEGGIIEYYVPHVQKYRDAGWSVEYRCSSGNQAEAFSAATLYLGFDQVCTAPDTVFGFHEPTTNAGVKLPQHRVDAYNAILTPFYPEPLREWYLREASYGILLLDTLTGQELADMLDNVTICEA